MSDENKLPDILYHYTSLEAFFGITKSKTLRLMSHKTQEKDPQELIGHDDEILKYLEINDVSLSEMYTFYKSLTIKNSATVFLTCFSHSSKNLALWKNFAKFSGVVIGINSKKANILLPNNEKIDSAATPKNSEKMQEASNLIKRASCNKVNYLKKNDLPEYMTSFSLPTPKLNEENKQYLDFQLDLSSIEEIWIDPRYFKDKLGLEEYLGSIGLSPNIVKEYKA